MTLLNALDQNFGSSGLAGTATVYPATAANGKLIFAAANSAGNFVVTNNFASQAGARTYTFPDCAANANFGLTQGAQTFTGTMTFSSLPVFSNGYTTVASYTNLQVADTTVSTSEVRALNVTPKTLVAAPGAGFSIVALGALYYLAAGTAYTTSGTIQIGCGTAASNIMLNGLTATGFLDQTSAQERYQSQLSGTSITYVDNTALQLSCTAAQTGGGSQLRVRVWYQVVPSTF